MKSQRQRNKYKRANRSRLAILVLCRLASAFQQHRKPFLCRSRQSFQTTFYSSTKNIVPTQSTTQSNSTAADDAEGSPSSSSLLSSCPVTPMLRRVPKVPLLGSFFPPLTGIPPLERRFPHRLNPRMNERFGDFYCMTVPTFGKDIQPDLYVITDETEMRKIVQSQPNNVDHGDVVPPKYQYPVGIVEQQWPFYDYLRRQRRVSDKNNSTISTANIFTRGPQWWEARVALQAGLTAAASSFEPAIVEGAVRASQRIALEQQKDDDNGNGWKHLPENFLQQLNRAAFDMFEQVLFRHPTMDQNNAQSDTLFRATLAGMLQAQDLRRSPWQNAARQLDMQTPAMKQCYSNLDTALQVLQTQIDSVEEKLPLRAEQATLGDDVGDCYVVQNLLQAQTDASSGNNSVARLPRAELPYACLTLLLGAIDTTAGKIAWNLLQLAFHPEIQQELYHEISQVCRRGAAADDDPTKQITTAVFDKAQTPLLHGIVRETHRVTPAVTVNLIKDALCPVNIHGVDLPRQSAVMFDSTTPQLQLVGDDDNNDYWTYDPYRWFPDAVLSRKSDPALCRLDHPYFAQPFGQGLRRCPGAAVALAEVHAFVAQFVLDWELALDDEPATNDNESSNDNLLHYRNVPSNMNTGPVPDFPDRMRIRRRRR